MTRDADGNCFIDSTLRFSGTTAPDAVAEMTVTVAGYEPVDETSARLPLMVGADGARYATGLRVSLDNVAASSLPGRNVTVVVHARAGSCASWTATDVVLGQ
jgi:hypothetical protein